VLRRGVVEPGDHDEEDRAGEQHAGDLLEPGAVDHHETGIDSRRPAL
jgi:hypothetical protein